MMAGLGTGVGPREAVGLIIALGWMTPWLRATTRSTPTLRTSASGISSFRFRPPRRDDGALTACRDSTQGRPKTQTGADECATDGCHRLWRRQIQIFRSAPS